jgi:hypothetical protein
MGYVEIGQDRLACLTKEFVKLVYQSSPDLTSPESGVPVIEYHKATSNNQFMLFQSILSPKVDIRQYAGGWLVNDVEHFFKLKPFRVTTL